ncbi:hypothetical protein AC578_5538 [Pseudocercospora eumusae]|uniref:Uncharacterized protein n=1 Tax=Pseudocercospora eumusae TaxID=321146 RepID=A0A139H3J7_9PEZI|nr:hypothetical protein AC578_5538 [Pseudocercospora eumusae]
MSSQQQNTPDLDVEVMKALFAEAVDRLCRITYEIPKRHRRLSACKFPGAWPPNADQGHVHYRIGINRVVGFKMRSRSFPQVVKAGRFANIINLFALAFTFSVAVLLIILDFVAFRILIGRPKRRLSPGIQFWIQDVVFQLQRAAFEGTGVGTWGRKDEEVPLTI